MGIRAVLGWRLLQELQPRELEFSGKFLGKDEVFQHWRVGHTALVIWGFPVHPVGLRLQQTRHLATLTGECSLCCPK